MPQAVVDPEEVRRFALALKRFTEDLQGQMGQVQGQLNGLSSSWRDQEQQKFAEEFAEASKAISRFLEAAQRHIPFLLRKAERAQEYLQQR